MGPRLVRCITFDKEAQDNLPQHIKDKMKANQEKALKKQQDGNRSTDNKEKAQ